MVVSRRSQVLFALELLAESEHYNVKKPNGQCRTEKIRRLVTGPVVDANRKPRTDREIGMGWVAYLGLSELCEFWIS